MDNASLTIAAAARLCGVHRRTLQRAIRAGRLRLKPDAQLTMEALEQAGYTAEAPQSLPQKTSHHTACDTAPQTAVAPQDTPQVLERMADALTSIAASLSLLCERLRQQGAPQGHTAEAPHEAPRLTPQRHAAETPGPTSMADRMYDPAPALARMQVLRQGGLSLAQIAAMLNTEGIPTRHGKPWHKGTVGYLLQGRGV